jgi:hypothetical protein
VSLGLDFAPSHLKLTVFSSSEKAESMFATLAIVLPSKHEGGEVKIIHTGKTKILDASKFSQTDLSYLAWCALRALQERDPANDLY